MLPHAKTSLHHCVALWAHPNRVLFTCTVTPLNTRNIIAGTSPCAGHQATQGLLSHTHCPSAYCGHSELSKHGLYPSEFAAQWLWLCALYHPPLCVAPFAIW